MDGDNVARNAPAASTYGHSSYHPTMFDEAVVQFVNLDPETPSDIKVRPLHETDYDHGFLDLLSQLTSVGDISQKEFLRRFAEMRDTQPKSYFVVVAEERSTNKVIAAATLVIELKFIHETGCRGRVEDVVVDKTFRGRKLGALLMKVLVKMAQEIGVYKLSLECKDSLISFYEQFGYKKDVGNNFLVRRFDGDSKEVVIPSSNAAEKPE